MVLLHNCQSFLHLLHLHLGFYYFLLSFMEFFIYLFVSNDESCIIPFPFLLLGFKIQGIDASFNTFPLIQNHFLQMFYFPSKYKGSMYHSTRSLSYKITFYKCSTSLNSLHFPKLLTSCFCVFYLPFLVCMESQNDLFVDFTF
jgi:hypothetical protein